MGSVHNMVDMTVVHNPADMASVHDVFLSVLNSIPLWALPNVANNQKLHLKSLEVSVSILIVTYHLTTNSTGLS